MFPRSDGDLDAIAQEHPALCRGYMHVSGQVVHLEEQVVQYRKHNGCTQNSHKQCPEIPNRMPPHLQEQASGTVLRHGRTCQRCGINPRSGLLGAWHGCRSSHRSSGSGACTGTSTVTGIRRLLRGGIERFGYLPSHLRNHLCCYCHRIRAFLVNRWRAGHCIAAAGVHRDCNHKPWQGGRRASPGFTGVNARGEAKKC